ncbi:MAG: S8 family serine peptidase [Planctomycetes bacterium]|nr:S8 family serine peptidase [Planctomycetota bacterium]
MSDEGGTDNERGDPFEAWLLPDDLSEMDEIPAGESRRDWTRFWRAITLVLACAAVLFFVLGKLTRSWYSRGGVALVIVDDFSGKKSHGSDVERAAQAALFAECGIRRVQFRGEQVGSLQKALKEVLAFRQAHQDEHIVLNFSFGSYSRRTVEMHALRALAGSRTLMVGAAGNDDTMRPMFPAAYDSVLAVAAVTLAGAKTSYSNYGDHIDLSAVPEQFVEEHYEGIEFYAGRGFARYTYLIRGGTSLSAPRVAAVAASIWSIRPDLTADEVKKVILKTCDPVAGSSLGHGILNVRRARAEVLPSSVLYESGARVLFVATLAALFIWGLVYGLSRPRGGAESEEDEADEE